MQRDSISRVVSLLKEMGPKRKVQTEDLPDNLNLFDVKPSYVSKARFTKLRKLAKQHNVSFYWQLKLKLSKLADASSAGVRTSGNCGLSQASTASSGSRANIADVDSDDDQLADRGRPRKRFKRSARRPTSADRTPSPSPPIVARTLAPALDNGIGDNHRSDTSWSHELNTTIESSRDRGGLDVNNGVGGAIDWYVQCASQLSSLPL